MKYVEKAIPKKPLSPDVGHVWYARIRFYCLDDLNTFFEVVRNIGSLIIRLP